jgi:histone acetyltransferase
MEHKLSADQYSSLDEFLIDAQLIYDNCRLYNPEGTIYAKNATRLEKYMKDQLADRMKKDVDEQK